MEPHEGPGICSMWPNNHIHVKYCCCISFILPPTWTPSSSELFETIHKINPNQKIFIRCTFFLRPMDLLPPKKRSPRIPSDRLTRFDVPPILWTFGLRALRVTMAWEETSCEGHLGTFKPREFTEKNGKFHENDLGEPIIL